MHRCTAPIVFTVMVACFGVVHAEPSPEFGPPEDGHRHGSGFAPPPGGPFAEGPHGMPHFEGGAVADAMHSAVEIERLYREQGRVKEVPALYEDILAKTRNPALRHFAYEALARAQMPPPDPDKAIAVLRRSLDESLKLADQPPPASPAPKP